MTSATTAVLKLGRPNLLAALLGAAGLLASSLAAAETLAPGAIMPTGLPLEPLLSLELPAQAQQGQTLNVAIRLDQPFAGRAADDVFLFYGFKLDFDPSQLRFKGFSAAEGWSDDSGFLRPGEIGASNFPGVAAAAAQSWLNLGALQFELLSAGEAWLQISSPAGDLNLGLGYAQGATNLPIDWRGSLQISAVPEPGALAMTLAGLLGLGLVQRRRVLGQNK